MALDCFAALAMTVTRPGTTGPICAALAEAKELKSLV